MERIRIFDASVYHTNIDKLTVSFIQSFKEQFKNSKVDIVIRDMNETDYLNISTKNKQYLESALQEVKDANFINKTISEL